MLDMLDKSAPSAHGAAWALFWVSGGWTRKEKKKKRILKTWKEEYTDRILNCVLKKDLDSNALRFLILILGWTKSPKAVTPLIAKLDESDSKIRQSAVGALASITGDEKIDQKLLSNSFNAGYPWLDPQKPISEKRIGRGAEELKISEEEVRRRYEVLAEKFNLKLEWKTSK